MVRWPIAQISLCLAHGTARETKVCTICLFYDEFSSTISRLRLFMQIHVFVNITERTDFVTYQILEQLLYFE